MDDKLEPVAFLDRWGVLWLAKHVPASMRIEPGLMPLYADKAAGLGEAKAVWHFDEITMRMAKDLFEVTGRSQGDGEPDVQTRAHIQVYLNNCLTTGALSIHGQTLRAFARPEAVGDGWQVKPLEWEGAALSVSPSENATAIGLRYYVFRRGDGEWCSYIEGFKAATFGDDFKTAAEAKAAAQADYEARIRSALVAPSPASTPLPDAPAFDGEG